MNENTIIAVISENINSMNTNLTNSIKDLRVDVKDLEHKVDKIDKKSLTNAIWTKVIGAILLVFLVILLIEAGIFSGYLNSGGSITIQPITNISTTNSLKNNRTNSVTKKGLFNK